MNSTFYFRWHADAADLFMIEDDLSAPIIRNHTKSACHSSAISNFNTKKTKVTTKYTRRLGVFVVTFVQPL